MEYNVFLSRGGCTRKKMSFESSAVEFSQQSIVSVMDKFVKAVANMNENILVPRKLMDGKVGSDSNLEVNIASKSRSFIRNLQAADLYNLYQTLNNMKTELIWATSPNDEENAPEVTRPQKRKTFARRTSVTSMPMSSASSISTAISDTDSEIGTDQDTEDSGVEIERDSTLDENEEDCVQKAASQFMRHLFGLRKSLEHLTDTANYLTRRYHLEIGSCD
ncbi:uncharacterized protein LOC136036470 isoform X3 [Artemia franciscana]|uniref:Mid1-interacting protein 1 n=1 Tax=Artemia franciscana TaxID=6661 RepID=A0AA88I5W1_ARTSF|nr:hypothetical protein QYM36_004367 [Artemia franciscana]